MTDVLIVGMAFVFVYSLARLALSWGDAPVNLPLVRWAGVTAIALVGGVTVLEVGPQIVGSWEHRAEAPPLQLPEATANLDDTDSEPSDADAFSADTTSAPTVYFTCEWPTEGFSDAAVQDCGAADWSTSPFRGDSSGVLDTSDRGRDYPTENFVRWSVEAGGDLGWVFLDAGVIPEPAVGDSVFVRYFERWVAPSSAEDNGQHGDYFGSPTDGWGPRAVGLSHILSECTTSQFQWVMSAGAAISNPPGRFWKAGWTGSAHVCMNRNQTYRYEYGYIRTGTTTYQINARIYHLNGTLLFDGGTTGSGGIVGDNGNGQNPSQSLHSQTFTLSGDAGAESIQYFRMGSEGWSGSGTKPFHVKEQAGLAICSSWCGAYPIAGVED